MAKIKSDTNQFVSGDLGVGRSLSVGGDLNLRGDTFAVMPVWSMG